MSTDIVIGKTYRSRHGQSYRVEKVEAGKVHVGIGGGIKLAYDERQFREQIMEFSASSRAKAVPCRSQRQQTRLPL